MICNIFGKTKMTSIGLQGIKILRAHKVPKSFLEFVYVVGFGTGVPATLFFFLGGGAEYSTLPTKNIFIFKLQNGRPLYCQNF